MEMWVKRGLVATIGGFTQNQRYVGSEQARRGRERDERHINKALLCVLKAILLLEQNTVSHNTLWSPARLNTGPSFMVQMCEHT